jgi:TolA-binding protein
MSLRNLIKNLFLWIALVPFSFLQAQHQKYFDEKPLLLRESLDLIQKEQYGAARQKLELFKKSEKDKNSVYYADATYYELLCAVQSGEKDASEKVKEFSRQNRSSSWMPRTYFLEGRVQFEQKRYSDALTAFNKVNPSDLPDFEKYELDYKTGFCLFRQNQPDEALERFSRIKDIKSPFQQGAVYYYAHIQYLKGNDDDAIEHFRRIRNDGQYKKIVPVYELQIHYRKGDYDLVIEKGDEVMQLVENRRRGEIARMIADAYYKKEDYIKSLSYYAMFENQNRRQMSREDHYQMGISRYKTSNFNDAIASFQQVIDDKDALSQSASYYLGQTYLETDQKTFARNAFLAAHKATYDAGLSEDALFNYALLSLETGTDPYNESVGLIEQYIETNPSSSRINEARNLIVQLYLKTRDYDAALASLEKNKNRNAEMQSIYEQLTYTLAVNLFNENNFTKASEYFSRIQQNNNSTYAAPALFWLAESKFQQKNYVDAQKFYRQFLAHREASKTQLVPLANYNLGYSFYYLKQYQQALSSFRQYTAAPSSKEPRLLYDAWLRIGDCHFISKEYDKAIEAYGKVVSARQAEADYGLFQQGIAHSAMGRHNEKINALDQLVKGYSKSAYYDNALYEMGATSLISNDYRSALGYFDKLIRERPRSTFARAALLKTGLIYFNNNQNEQAITQLKKVAETYPGTPDAREALNTLRVIYMEMNKLEDYFVYAKRMGFGEVSVSEQDSLAFTMAENFYNENRHNDAAQAFSSYLKNYPNGGFTLQAHHFKSKLDISNNKTDEALRSLEYIIGVNNNPYLEEALLAAARIQYDKQKYDEAYRYYSNLYTLSDDPNEKLEALEGKMKSSYFTGKYEEAIQSSRQLLSNEKVRPEQQLQAHYIAGKSLFETKRYLDAKEELMKTHRLNNSAMGAEAYYLIARISFENNFLDDAENQIFDLAEKYASQDYWVAKSFILLADIYVKNNNIFQAKETLKSIVDNYKGEDLRQEAARKLSMLK